MRYLPLLLSLALAACAHAPRPNVAGPVAPHPDVEVVGPGMPRFDLPHNWTIVKTVGIGEDTVNVVTLSRPELQGTMRLEVVKTDCENPTACAAKMRARLADAGFKTGPAPGPDTDQEAGFVWHDARVHPEDPTFGKILFRRIPGHPGLMALCDGWWPASALDFLVAPLHAACVSVRPMP